MSDRPAAIDAMAADPASAALFLDFDGVLAPIVSDPTASAMPQPVAATLRQLAPALRVLAVISGRPASFLAQRVPVPGARLLGSYGMEVVRDGVRELDPAVEPWLPEVAQAQGALEAAFAGSQGIRVETKAVSVAVHWRQAADRDAAAARVRAVTSQVVAQTGLRLEPGKLVEELRPPVETDKGTAIFGLVAAERPAAVSYAGDDLGDLPALRAVREAEGYALVVCGDDTDPRLLAAADQTFAGTEDFANWLADLADRVSR